MKKNIFLLFGLITISTIAAILLGELINNYLFPGSGGLVPSEITNFVNSFPFLYLLLSPIIFIVWGEGKKWVWIIASILLLLATTIYAGSGTKILLLSAEFLGAGIIIALAINFFRKQRTTK